MPEKRKRTLFQKKNPQREVLVGYNYKNPEMTSENWCPHSCPYSSAECRPPFPSLCAPSACAALPRLPRHKCRQQDSRPDIPKATKHNQNGLREDSTLDPSSLLRTHPCPGLPPGPGRSLRSVGLGGRRRRSILCRPSGSSASTSRFLRRLE